MRAAAGRKPIAKSKVSHLHCRWYLCDDARAEIGGKISLLGVYVDDTVVIEMAPDDPEPTSEMPIAIEGLTILCALSGFEGHADFVLTLRDTPAPVTVRTRTLVVDSTSSAGTINLLSKFRPVLIDGFGEKVFTIASPALGFKEDFAFRIIRRATGSQSQTARVTHKVDAPQLQIPRRKATAKKRVASK